MNFNVYLNKETGKRITQVSKSLHRSRNSIINEALDEWLEAHTKSKWPKNFFDFSPVEEVPDFKSFRSDLKDNFPEDPLA